MDPILKQLNPVHTLKPQLFNSHFHIILKLAHRFLKWSLFITISNQISHNASMRSAHPAKLSFPNLIILIAVQITDEVVFILVLLNMPIQTPKQKQNATRRLMKP
jgi:hypothetical protein